jgi:hypothetical protein
MRPLVLLLLLATYSSFAQKTAFELDSNSTFSYANLIEYYQDLDQKYEQAQLQKHGLTDSGKPLHLLVISQDQTFKPEEARKKGKTVIFINNGIHPGEPEGIDASAMLARDILKENKLSNDLVICIVPIYNIGGMLNRGTSRVNQNGPKEYGFRGNAKNYDLNRDFIKTDSKNSQSFQEIFQQWKPDLFMDTHTSNGADYQYIMTLIDTQNSKLHPELQPFAKELTESLCTKMKATGYPMIPYVNSFKGTPESGIVSFLETPRYSTGYASLNQVIGYMPETHMWKPYAQRVSSTYALLQHFIDLNPQQIARLKQARKATKESVIKQMEFPLTWKLDTTRYETLEFLGYESGEKPSSVTGLNRLFYDREKPFVKSIRYYNQYKPEIVITKPMAYIVPQGWTRVIELLKINGVEMRPLAEDQKMEVEMYYIESYKTSPSPYEGHYMHSDVQLKSVNQEVQFYKGDVMIYTNQEANRYLIETLEPQAHDSFFNWNFFDSILGQKEHFSAYIFEEEAYKLLQENPILKAEFEKRKAEDEKFKTNARAQLDWIYKRSPYYEKTHLRYPIARLKQ